MSPTRVYFEARGESVRGQIAVAQVVMNRVFRRSIERRLRRGLSECASASVMPQFTFACDGIPTSSRRPDAWERAKRIARDMLDGKVVDAGGFKIDPLPCLPGCIRTGLMK
jgi:spore germination cell wall hydrolase CwlJ-like protein